MGSNISVEEYVVPIPFEIYTIYLARRRVRFSKAYVFHCSMCSSEQYRRLSDSAKTKLLVDIENGCLSHAIDTAKASRILLNWRDTQFMQVYDGICMKIAANLNMRGMCKNEFLLPKVLNGEIPARKLGSMSSRELMPQLYVNFDLSEKATDTNEYLTTTRIYTCGKCKHRECRTTVLQLRALDEGSNIKIECLNCRHTWII